MDQGDCYGKLCDRLDACASCKEHPWCKEASDPKPLTGPTPGTVAGGDAAYEAAQQEPHEREKPNGHIAFATKMNDAADMNTRRIAVMMLRMSGMTYDDVGQRFTPPITRQAVCKHIAAIEAKNPRIGAILRQRHEKPVDPNSRNARMALAYEEMYPVWHAHKCGPSGLYGMLAQQFNVVSWKAVRDRLDHMGVLRTTVDKCASKTRKGAPNP